MATASKIILSSILLLPAFNLAASIAYGQENPPVARLSHQNSRSQISTTQKAGIKTLGPQAPGTQAKASTTKHVTRQSLPKPSLVPPPPPNALMGLPLDFMSGGLGMIAPEYQSAAQLKKNLNDLTDQLTRASKALEDKQKSSQEKKGSRYSV